MGVEDSCYYVCYVEAVIGRICVEGWDVENVGAAEGRVGWENGGDVEVCGVRHGCWEGS